MLDKTDRVLEMEFIHDKHAVVQYTQPVIGELTARLKKYFANNGRPLPSNLRVGYTAMLLDTTRQP